MRRFRNLSSRLQYEKEKRGAEFKPENYSDDKKALDRIKDELEDAKKLITKIN